MLSGFNTNVRHRGVLFHVQSEDSGRAHPHVITHLYHGGTILASEKRGYAEYLEDAALSSRVRELMEAQHAAMLERLQGGELDEVIGERLGPDVFGAARSGGATGHTQREARGAEATGPPTALGSAPPERPAAPADPPGVTARTQRSGDRPLDELILDYLVETTRRTRLERREQTGAQRKLE